MADIWGATNATPSGEWEEFNPTLLRDLLAERDRLREALEQIAEGWVPSERKGPGRWGVNSYIVEYAREALTPLSRPEGDGDGG